MASIEEIKRAITGTTATEWKRFRGTDQLGPWVYRQDPSVRIEQTEEFVDGYPQPWTNRFPNDRNDATALFRLYYGSSPIDEFVVVATDGFGLFLPAPTVENPDTGDLDDYTFSISQYEATIGRVLSPDAFDSRLPGPRLEIRDDVL